MAKHLNKNDIEKAKDVLDGWEGKLTWDLFVEAFEMHVGRPTTRQALSRNSEIKSCFNERKTYLKSGIVSKSKPQTLKSAAQSIDRLKSENVRLKAENEKLLEMFLIWQYNAYKRGLTDIQLNEPLPDIDRRS